MIIITVEIQCMKCEEILFISRTQFTEYSGLPGTLQHEGCRVSQ